MYGCFIVLKFFQNKIQFQIKNSSKNNSKQQRTGVTVDVGAWSATGFLVEASNGLLDCQTRPHRSKRPPTFSYVCLSFSLFSLILSLALATLFIPSSPTATVWRIYFSPSSFSFLFHPAIEQKADHECPRSPLDTSLPFVSPRDRHIRPKKWGHYWSTLLIL